MTTQEIIDETRRLTKATVTSYPTADIISSSNRALDRITTLQREAEGRWQADDSNYDDLPFFKTPVAANIGDYTLDPAIYRIERAEFKDQNGGWFQLIPFDVADPRCQSYTSLRNSTGTPQIYDKVGNSIILAPKPIVSDTVGDTSTWSLRVYAERGAYYLSSSDLSQTVGFNPMFHRLITLWNAYDFALINQQNQAKGFRQEIAVLEKQLQTFYSLRDKDDKIQLKAKRYNFI